MDKHNEMPKKKKICKYTIYTNVIHEECNDMAFTCRWLMI